MINTHPSQFLFILNFSFHFFAARLYEHHSDFSELQGDIHRPRVIERDLVSPSAFRGRSCKSKWKKVKVVLSQRSRFFLFLVLQELIRAL